MRFRTQDGELFSGRSYAKIVAEMASSKPESISTLENYRKSTAERAKDMFDVEIDASSNTSFIKSLLEAGLLEEL